MAKHGCSGMPFAHEDERLHGHHDDPEMCDGGKVTGYAKGGETHWISGAIRHPGALHRRLGVPQGQKIPAKKLAAAAHSSSPAERREASLAKTLKGFHH